MTPKEKAIDMYNSFRNEMTVTSANWRAKKMAMISVDEIISQWEYIDAYLADGGGELNPNLKYWQEVKQELEKL